MGLFNLKKGRLKEDLVAAYQYIRGIHRDFGEQLFTRAPLEKTSNSGHKLLEDCFRLKIRKNFFTVRVSRLWNKLPPEVVQ